MVGKGPRAKARTHTAREKTASFRSGDLEVLEGRCSLAPGAFVRSRRTAGMGGLRIPRLADSLVRSSGGSMGRLGSMRLGPASVLGTVDRRGWAPTPLDEEAR
jgi:hypothetical protein